VAEFRIQKSFRAYLGVNANGIWYLRLPQGSQPVVLLHSKSLWLAGWAFLTLRPVTGSLMAVWIRQRNSCPDAWRRLAVWFNCG
jgi:hypothetical protein